MTKTYPLTKEEYDIVSDLSRFIAEETKRSERIIAALNLQFQVYLSTEVFKRLELDTKLLGKCTVDVQAGIISIPAEQE